MTWAEKKNSQKKFTTEIEEVKDMESKQVSKEQTENFTEIKIGFIIN